MVQVKMAPDVREEMDAVPIWNFHQSKFLWKSGEINLTDLIQAVGKSKPWHVGSEEIVKKKPFFDFYQKKVDEFRKERESKKVYQVVGKFRPFRVEFKPRLDGADLTSVRQLIEREAKLEDPQNDFVAGLSRF